MWRMEKTLDFEAIEEHQKRVDARWNSKNKDYLLPS